MKEFDSIYKRHYPAVFSIAIKMVSDADSAGDIIQEVFLSYFETMQKGKQVDSPGNYLARATLNKCIDYRKRQGKFEKIDGQEKSSGEEAGGRTDNREVIRMALLKLEERERTLVVLYSEGYSYREISEITGIRFTSLGKTLARTLIKVKEELKRLEYEMPGR